MMATPSWREGAQAAASASGVKPSTPSVSADHRSVYPSCDSSAYQLRWSSRLTPSKGTVIPKRGARRPTGGAAFSCAMPP